MLPERKEERGRVEGFQIEKVGESASGKSIQEDALRVFTKASRSLLLSKLPWVSTENWGEAVEKQVDKF